MKYEKYNKYVMLYLYLKKESFLFYLNLPSLNSFLKCTSDFETVWTINFIFIYIHINQTLKIKMLKVLQQVHT